MRLFGRLSCRAAVRVGWTDFKVSKRREMDISIVAGAFRVACDAAGVVTEAWLAFGGVAATPVRALKAEAALVGKTLAGAVAEVATVSADGFTPIDDVRGGAEYRRGLIVSLVGEICEW